MKSRRWRRECKEETSAPLAVNSISRLSPTGYSLRAIPISPEQPCPSAPPVHIGDSRLPELQLSVLQRIK